MKQAYIQGKIDKVPWESYVAKGVAKRYIMKENGEQVTRTAVSQGYTQNSEQSENTIWSRIRDKD